MTEKQFENQVKRFLESKGVFRLGTPRTMMNIEPLGYYVKRWGGGRYVQEGLPDLQIVVCGISIDVELKAENGVLSMLQQQKIEQINDCGAIGIVLYPKGFEQFKKSIENLIVYRKDRTNEIQLFTRGLLQ